MVRIHDASLKLLETDFFVWEEQLAEDLLRLLGNVVGNGDDRWV